MLWATHANPFEKVQQNDNRLIKEGLIEERPIKERFIKVQHNNNNDNNDSGLVAHGVWKTQS